MRQQIQRQKRLKSDSNEINSPTLKKTFNIQLDESSLTLRKQFQNNKQQTIRKSILTAFYLKYSVKTRFLFVLEN